MDSSVAPASATRMSLFAPWYSSRPSQSFPLGAATAKLRFGIAHRTKSLAFTRVTVVALSSADGRPKQRRTSTKSEEYNRIMQQQMRNPYEYHHDLGMNYTRITPNLIVGSQPQTAEDISYLKQEEGVTAILNLQQDKDIEYWGVDLPSIVKRCQDLGIRHMRCPARDFDPNSLRNELPKAVSLVEEAISEGNVVYVHCTAGLGRAPAVAIAYLFWFSEMDVCLCWIHCISLNLEYS
eukprot:TRINITY_DN3007_c0_g1_i1.p1 TRINITY_DN3007_c0_g1~~TRINITY_DN3007_c0_g1_i1.p1  ORF type:complete len:271 (+),score=23.17 TRINITY_DN3007_c0_g1_i1:103-813(+)